MQPLKGKIVVVTGATRGAGKGIARAFGEAGATVIVTGRSSREHPSTFGWPGTIEDTAELVEAAGGVGVPVRLDQGDEAAVSAFFARVAAEHGAPDVLVNNAWGGHETPIDMVPFWETSLQTWESMFTHGVRLALMASTCAAPSMVAAGRGLILNTTSWYHDVYTGMLYYDLAKNALNRLAFGMAQDLEPHGVTALAVAPGWMRTELVLGAFETDEAHWREVPALAATETPLYVGRAMAALAADPRVMEKTGRTLLAGDLAREYGFTDEDGSQPPAFVLEGRAPVRSGAI